MNNPFQYGFPMMTPTVPVVQPTVPHVPTLPQQQVLQVDGKASIDTIQLAPNSSLLAMDRTAPIVWLCVSDGIGKVTSTPYDITLHQDKPPIDAESIEQRLAMLEKTMAEMEGKVNARQSNADGSKPKQEYSKHGEH